MSELTFKFFPWENDIKPYFTNEEGFEWYIDEEMTKHARRDVGLSIKGRKDLFAFFVKKGDDIDRVLTNDKQQILHSDKTLEGMACKIDILKLVKHHV